LVWRIELSATAEKQLSKIGKADAKRIVAFLRERIAAGEPRQMGKALHGAKFKGLWRYRVGDYRVICQLQDSRLVVLVVEIGHRREVYRTS
jgi:mRNA interferase RelE/StbE